MPARRSPTIDVQHIPAAPAKRCVGSLSRAPAPPPRAGGGLGWWRFCWVGGWPERRRTRPTRLRSGALTLESATPTSLTVTWDVVAGGSLYSIQWRRSDQARLGPNYAGKNGRHVISGLLPGREYVVRIEVYAPNASVLARIRGVFRTPLTAPEELSVTAATSSSLSVSWSKPEGWNPAGYRLRWRKPSDAQYLGTATLASSATGHTITGLTDQTEYVINLFARNDLGAAGTETSVTAIAVDPLTLTLTSSRNVCTANTLTELSWEITGGLLPHQLFIGGKKIDLDNVESHRANCGPIPTDPTSGDPVANPTKTFSAMVKDKRGLAASAEIWIALTALTYSHETKSLRYQTYDATGAAATPGSYAFLASSDDSVRAITTYEGLRDGTATGLRINTSDAAGTSQADHFDTVAVADIFEWREADNCFVRYKVTAIEPATTGATSKHIEVERMTYAFTGCSGAIASDAAATVSFGSLPHLGGPMLTAPVVHGVYQIVPVGWTGATKAPVRSERSTVVPEFRQTRDISEARQMRHWREISVPDGWRFEKAQQGEEISSVDGYCAWYVTSSSERGLEICATKGIRIWFGAGKSDWHDGTSVRETRVVAGRPASVIYSTRDPYFPLTLRVYDAATQVEYTIYGHHKSVRGANGEAVVAIAESLFSPSRPFGPSQSASPTSSSARGTAQAQATIEIDVFAGATAGEKEISTRGWHGPPYGNDHSSKLDDGALDWHVGSGKSCTSAGRDQTVRAGYSTGSHRRSCCSDFQHSGRGSERRLRSSRC